jgi:hypothetical protein
MNDDDVFLPSDLDPAKLLPRTVQFEPDNPNAIGLPKRYFRGDYVVPSPEVGELSPDD